ncbi:MAG: hypothetical protein AAGA87_01845 [Pseudomonadota bacterium]
MGRTVLFFLFLVAAGAVMAGGERPVYLLDGTGQRVQIASLRVAPDGSYDLTMANAPFTDHFLSMRPFKCLEGPEKHWCHVPYPYPNARNISVDFVDLEYDLLFLWKGATDYGIDTWNGIYYVLTKDGAALVGAAHEIDLSQLAVPPQAGDMRPVSAEDLHETDPDSHRLPRLEIPAADAG